MGICPPFFFKNKKMSKKKEVQKNIKVKALEPMVKYGYAYSEGDVFEVDAKLANEWVDIKAVEVLK